MSRMRAVDAIVRILEKEGATQAFGVPGAAINPLYSAMKEHGGIRHVLARHVEGALHVQSLAISVFALEHRVPVAPI